MERHKMSFFCPPPDISFNVLCLRHNLQATSLSFPQFGNVCSFATLQTICSLCNGGVYLHQGH